jgi:hypothetical protein
MLTDLTLALQITDLHPDAETVERAKLGISGLSFDADRAVCIGPYTPCNVRTALDVFKVLDELAAGRYRIKIRPFPPAA